MNPFVFHIMRYQMVLKKSQILHFAVVDTMLNYPSHVLLH